MNPAPRIVCVLEPCGSPLLVLLPDTVPMPAMLEVYARMGQHSQAGREYVRIDCRDADPQAPNVKSLVREWCNLGPDKIDPETVQFFTRAQSDLS